MNNDLISKLSEIAQSAIGAEAQGLALARYGIALAQMGRTEEAAQISKRLRDDYGDFRDSSVSIYILLFEGVLIYYSTRDVGSVDRVHRSNLLAKSLGFDRLEVESAVWLVHLAFNFQRLDLLSNALKTCVVHFGKIDIELRGRFCLCVADIYQYLGLNEISSRWYIEARRFARLAHDRGVIAAIEYNRLCMGLSRLRLESNIKSVRTVDDRRNWLLELSSVDHLHVGLGANALSELLVLCSSRVSELDGDYRAAMSSLVQIKNRHAAWVCGVSLELLELEILWCQFKCGEIDDRDLCNILNLDQIDVLSIEEQLVALTFIKDIFNNSNNELNWVRFQSMMDRAIKHCSGRELLLINAMTEVTDNQEYLFKKSEEIFRSQL